MCAPCRNQRSRDRYASDPEYRAQRNAQNVKDYLKAPEKKAEYQRARYSDPAHREAQRLRQIASREKRRAQWWAHLGGVCVQCGSSQDLHFDHIHWQEKRLEVSKLMFRDVTDPEAAAEFAKCQLLCAPCHYAKSVVDRREMKRIKRADPAA